MESKVTVCRDSRTEKWGGMAGGGGGGGEIVLQTADKFIKSSVLFPHLFARPELLVLSIVQTTIVRVTYP